jgi:tRNA threonylcarbamoyladenosine biosynthesis protein TsaB
MTILALDTSGERCSVAVARDGVLLAEYNFLHQRHLTERLPAIVTALLQDCGITLKDITHFVVGIGPGSFTGVRLGVTFAKVWAEVYQMPLLGISSLDILAYQFPALGQEIGIAPITLARKGELITAFYKNGEHLPTFPAFLIETSEIVARMQVCFAEHPLVIIAESRVLLDTLQPYLSDTIGMRLVTRVDYLRASTLIEITQDRIACGTAHWDDPATLVPLYVAPTPVG